MITWLRRLSWKTKLLVVFVIGSIVAMGYFFSTTGQDAMRDKVEEYYNDIPVAERRDSAWADWYLRLAWIRGNIIGDVKESMEMYQKFLGLVPDKNGQSVFDTGKLNGLCSDDGKTGWGPVHPRAAEAFYAFIEMYDTTNASSQYVKDSCVQYYNLLYDWMVDHGPSHKPHPRFKAYWQKVMNIAEKSHVPWPGNVNKSAPLAPLVDDE